MALSTLADHMTEGVGSAMPHRLSSIGGGKPKLMLVFASVTLSPAGNPLPPQCRVKDLGPLCRCLYGRVGLSTGEEQVKPALPSHGHVIDGDDGDDGRGLGQWSHDC